MSFRALTSNGGGLVGFRKILWVKILYSALWKHWNSLLKVLLIHPSDTTSGDSCLSGTKRYWQTLLDSLDHFHSCRNKGYMCWESEGSEGAFWQRSTLAHIMPRWCSFTHINIYWWPIGKTLTTSGTARLFWHLPIFSLRDPLFSSKWWCWSWQHEYVTDICSWALRLALRPCPLSHPCRPLQQAVCVYVCVCVLPCMKCPSVVLYTAGTMSLLGLLPRSCTKCSQTLPACSDSRQNYNKSHGHFFFGLLFFHFCFRVTSQTCRKACGAKRRNSAAATQTQRRAHCRAGVGRWVNKIAIFACHIRVTASKDTSAVSTHVNEWHLTELQTARPGWPLSSHAHTFCNQLHAHTYQHIHCPLFTGHFHSCFVDPGLTSNVGMYPLFPFFVLLYFHIFYASHHICLCGITVYVEEEEPKPCQRTRLFVLDCVAGRKTYFI